MTKEAIDQIYDRARHGDVFAQALMGQILIEGKNVQKDVQIYCQHQINRTQKNVEQ